MSHLGAAALIDHVTDPDSFRSWDQPLGDVSQASDDPGYQSALRAARERTGLDEAIVTGEASIDGRRVAIVVSEFGFLGGSIGVDAARRLVAAVERATAERLPLLAAPASGGTRMQEGTPAFVHMVAIADAVMRHRRARLPYLAYLRDPTTGGVFASWASLAHITVAEPGALVGFLGPRATAAMVGEELPRYAQRAEYLYRHGLLDAVVPADQLRDVAATALRVIADAGTDSRPPGRENRPLANGDAPRDPNDADPWDAVRRSRRPDRPDLRALIRSRATNVLPLSGTGDGERDHSVLVMLAELDDWPCVVVGHERRRPLMPGGLRVARRGMRLAAELGLPLVTVIDTGGAALSVAAEQSGLAGEIARCSVDLLALPTTVVCVLLGAGTGGAALALLPADVVVAARHAWLAPLAPEGAAAVRFRDPSRAAEMAASQGITSGELRRIALVDHIIDERPDAADEPDAFLARVSGAVGDALAALRGRSIETLVATRATRFHRTARP